MNLKLLATPEEVMRGVEALQTYGEKHGLDPKILFGLTLALEECASNIVNHALERDATRSFYIAFEKVGGQMVIELRDAGPAFDPTTIPDRIPSPEDDDEPPGGWGIQLVRRYVDEIQYQRLVSENVLRLIKNISTSL